MKEFFFTISFRKIWNFFSKRMFVFRSLWGYRQLPQVLDNSDVWRTLKITLNQIGSTKGNHVTLDCLSWQEFMQQCMFCFYQEKIGLLGLIDISETHTLSLSLSLSLSFSLSLSLSLTLSSMCVCAYVWLHNCINYIYIYIYIYIYSCSLSLSLSLSLSAACTH